MPGANTVQSVERAISILQFIAASEDGLRLSDLAEEMDLNTTTVHNLVRTLIGRGLLAKGAKRRLRLGPALGDMLAQELRRTFLHTAGAACRFTQDRLPASTVNFCELMGTDIRIRIRMSADRPGLIQRPIGHNNCPYGTASGLCFQAFAPATIRETLRDTYPFHEHGAQLWSTLEALDEFLKHARSLGHVEAPFQKDRRSLIAMPIRDSDNTMVAALGCALPLQAEADHQRALAVLREAVAQINVQHSTSSPAGNGDSDP